MLLDLRPALDAAAEGSGPGAAQGPLLISRVRRSRRRARLDLTLRASAPSAYSALAASLAATSSVAASPATSSRARLSTGTGTASWSLSEGRATSAATVRRHAPEDPFDVLAAYLALEEL